jgi:hypothetical protein
MLAITKEDFLEIETQYRVLMLEREKAALQSALDLQREITRNACMANCQAEYKRHCANARTAWAAIIGFGLGALWICVEPAVFGWLRGLL